MKSKSTDWVIQPDTIRRKALRRYKEFLQAWFHGNVSELFPMEIHGRKKVASQANWSELVRQMQLLREESKEHRKRSYRVDWKSINSPRFGKNDFPERIFIDTCEDYLFLTEKKQEFLVLESVVVQIRDLFPELERCLATQLSILPLLADDIEPLIALLKFFREHPKPDCFVREIPAPGVHTKFIERPEIENVLRQWLDVILPAWAICSDEHHFARRYFLRYDEQLIRLRFLDATVQKKLHFPCSDVSVPLHTFANLGIQDINVVIVENKTSLLILPTTPNTIVLGGLGYAVTLLKYAPWLRKCRLTYWGDLDSDGFRILSNFREIFPAVQSMLMDAATLQRFESLLTKGNGQWHEIPPFLTEDEKSAFLRCRNENIRLEQERIPVSALSPLANFISFG